MPMEPRASRVVNQSKRAPSVCTDGLIKGSARRPWILAAAQSFSLRREFQTLNGGKIRGISHATDNDPKQTAEGRSRREWCREEPHSEEPYALEGVYKSTFDNLRSMMRVSASQIQAVETSRRRS